MTVRHRCYATFVTFFFIFVLSGCLSSSHTPQQFATSFLPAPLPAPAADQDSPAPQHHSLYLNGSKPNLAQRSLPQIEWPNEIDSRILSADQHFEAAKKFYQQGDMDSARREFNRSIDVLLSVPEKLQDSPKLERKLDELVDNIYRYDLEGLGSGQLQDKVVYDKSPIDGILDLTFPVDPKLKPKVTEEIQATVSQLPLEVNDSVLSYIHYFSTDRGRKVIVSGLRHSGRYKPLISRILDEEGVPQELIFLAQAESGFMPRAVSSKQAEGMWQFVQFRGREYGLVQTAQTDDRLDPEKATRAAARHLRDLYTHFGDWYLAMAAYNCGPGRVDNAIMRTGYADFWELRNRDALPHETMNYVPLILALTIMAKNPKDYGLEGVDLDPAVEYDTLDLKAPTNLALIADAAERPVSAIRDLNPGLLAQAAPSGYPLHIPKGTSATVLAALDNVPLDRRATWRMHRVEQGETLAQIAKHFATPATSIAQANNRLEEAPEAGDLLIIPASYSPAASTPHAASRKIVSSRSAKAPARPASVRASAPRTQPKTFHPRTVSERVLHHRARPKTVRTASVHAVHDSE